MAHTTTTPPAPHSPNSAPKRPKGILKNSTSYQHILPDAGVTSPVFETPPEPSPTIPTRPGPPGRELSEKEIVQLNTELNAGPRRRTGSNPQGALSRRQSGQSSNGELNGGLDESQMRLKWDEANLYLNEGQMGGRMKIDEPKTPFTAGYDPADDEEEVETINAQDLAVDELDLNSRSKTGNEDSGKGEEGGSRGRLNNNDIPGLDLGEPEVDPNSMRDASERRVHVDPDHEMTNGGGDGEPNGHGEDEGEEREKHRKFEEMRKKHYEMKNVKNLLGHPESLDALDD